MTSTLAPVLEVFSSIQGEGAYVGEPQVFLRLRGCPLRCAWCDTPGSWRLSGDDRARIATPDGFERRPAWATPFQAACWVAETEPSGPRTVSVTGGEPLLWPEFLLALPSMLGGRRLHLETGGGHPRTLARVLDAFAHVSLDLKLPADVGPPVEVTLPPGLADDEDLPRPTDEAAPTDDASWRRARRDSLALVRGRDAALKIVVAGGRGARDFEPLFEDVAARAPENPVYLQPATACGGVAAPSPDLLFELVEDARDLGLTVRVVPQVHRLLAVP